MNSLQAAEWTKEEAALRIVCKSINHYKKSWGSSFCGGRKRVLAGVSEDNGKYTYGVIRCVP
jgi:hypothetical protein